MPAVRILQLTDFHFTAVAGGTLQGIDTEQSFSRLVRSIIDSKQRYDLLLLTGDLAEDPTEPVYRRIRQQLQAVADGAPCYCLPGNHDDIDAMRKFLLGGEIRMESRIVLDHWQIVCLDSTVPGQAGGFLEEGQIDLLRQAMLEQPEKHLLVAVHHHPILCQSEWMDTMVIRNGARLQTVLESSPGRTRSVVFGHIHQTLDRTINGIRFLGSPSTCCQFKPYSRDFRLDTLPPGYRWITLHPNGDLATGVEYLKDDCSPHDGAV